MLCFQLTTDFHGFLFVCARSLSATTITFCEHEIRPVIGPKHRSPIMSSNGCLPGAGEKPVASVVWRLGSTLLEIPQLPPCVGVAPLGRARSAQPLPWFFPGPMGDPVCQGRHLRWFVRGALTAPNAPNEQKWATSRPSQWKSSECSTTRARWRELL